ncbi:MAG: Amuc_1100 family pilus-like protein [Verrucomicrobiota bacterium]|nr:Amuc_1100 family pilus-like protein [Verrucomicrobiota bacterium]
MNWARENRFLAVFGGAVLVCLIALSVLLFLAHGRYAAVSEQYEAQSREFLRLENLAPYPSAENLAKLQEQKQAYLARIAALQARLAETEFPIEPMTPEQFQDRLRSTVSDITNRAEELHVKLPPKFYLGFDRYQTEPPRGEAAAPLGRQLKAIELVINTLIESRSDALLSIKRTPLPEEGGAPARPTPARPGAPAAAPKSDLVARYPFDIGFVAEQSRFRKIFNEIVSTRRQFLIVRTFRIRNQSEKGPVRQAAPDAMATPIPYATPMPQARAPGAQASPESRAEPLKFIVGTEKLNIDMRIDMVDFAEVGAAK